MHGRELSILEENLATLVESQSLMSVEVFLTKNHENVNDFT